MADEGYEYEEVSDEEKLRIAKTYLLQSPPGQFFEVLKGINILEGFVELSEPPTPLDVRQLLPSHVLTDAELEETAYAYNTSSYLPAPVSGDRSVGRNMIVGIPCMRDRALDFD